MASYREKTNQKKLSTESGKIAWAIDWIETHNDLLYAAMREPDEILIDDNISVRRSKESPIWIISKSVELKANRCLEKYVQWGMGWERSMEMLDAQPWLYI